jgi:hypothetical protein
MWGIDTVEEWLLVTVELLVITTLALLAIMLACLMVGWYLLKTLWYWDLNYLIER